MERRTVLRAGVMAAVVALAVVGVAYAAIPHGIYGDTTACFKNSNGQLRVVDVSAGESCNASESPLGLYQGYVQLVRRAAGPSALAGPGFTPVVGSSLLGSHLRPVYAITGKVVVETKLAAESRCRLTAENAETPQFVLDESRNVPAINATHNLQGVVFAPMDIRILCTADQDWTALESSIMGVKVGKGASIVTTDADPITP
jgi:hypothetical protein